MFPHVLATQTGVSNTVLPSCNQVFLRVQFTQGGIEHVGPELEPRVYMSRPPRAVSNTVVPSWNHAFTCPGYPRRHLTWMPQVGTT
eukprot:9301583-Pyramimonas_sp.AAC.1